MDNLLTSFTYHLATISMKPMIPHTNYNNNFLATGWKKKVLVSRIVCMAVKLADPDIVSNPSEYQKIAQSMSDLDEVVTYYRQFKDCERQIQEAKALSDEDGNDPDMVEMIASEIESLSKQLKTLEDKLTMLLLPSDPLDSRNILLEVRAGTGGDEAGLWAGDLVG